MLTRREFLMDCMVCAGAAAAAGSTSPVCVQAEGGEEHIPEAREARFYNKLEAVKVECVLCPKKCKVGDRERGYCGVRENRDGVYYTLAYANPCTMHVDPVEKKPFFHYKPGSRAFSIATAGCNFNCGYCQNWQISQSRPEQTENFHMKPEDVAESAKKAGCACIAYTYTEPVVFLEYALDCAREGHKRGIDSVFVSNGYINEEPAKELCENVDAVKIDFKGYSEKFYKEICDGTLKPVLDSMKLVRKSGVWFEIVDLVIPTLNDGEEELKELCRWIVDNLGKDVPVHFSRFHPTYKLKNLPGTRVEVLERAREIALGHGINYAYTGNVVGHEGENTYCPRCRKVLIRRVGYHILGNFIRDGKCPDCNNEIAGKWS